VTFWATKGTSLQASPALCADVSHIPAKATLPGQKRRMSAPATRLLNALSLITVVHLASTGHVYELTSPPGIVPSCDPTGNGAGAADCLENQPDATVAADSGSTLKTVLVVVVAVLTIFAIACACFLRHRYVSQPQPRGEALAGARERRSRTVKI